MPYFEKLPGERLFLSPVDPDDAETYARWVNDLEITRWLDMTNRLFSLPAERAFLEEAAKKTDNYQFAIVLRDENRLLGSVGLMDVHNTNRTATLGIFIGEAADRGKGYGAEAIKLLLDYGFRWLGLRNIDLHVNCENERAIACYKKVGFREYGRRRDAIFRDGEWVDRIHMEVLAQEWMQSYGEA